MVNALFYKNLILKITKESGDLPSLVDGRLCVCEHHCSKCFFYSKPCDNCTINFIKWAYQEADSSTFLTDDEIEFLSLLNNGYIYRTAVETFWLEKMENPFEPGGKVICISERFGLFFYNLENYAYYSIQSLKENIK